MPQATNGEVGRKMRKQLRNFRTELAHAGIKNRDELSAYLARMPARRQEAIAGLVKHVFTAPPPPRS
jgi:hypothetical protein